jgi:prephenate dehydrogenase
MNRVFVGGHPMAGSEKTGYENSTDHLLENAYYLITPTPETPPEMTARLREVAKALGAIPMILDYHRHDQIVAAISHLPHLIAATLVNLVHDSDGKDQMMTTLAAGGFKDITRIASSSPVMWEQICMTNTDNIVAIADRYIASLTDLRNRLAGRQTGAVFDTFTRSSAYRNSFPDVNRGSIMPDFSFSIDCRDEPGAISIISSILAVAGINIRNIGINNNREQGEGAMEISFYDRESMEKAMERLTAFNYKILPR